MIFSFKKTRLSEEQDLNLLLFVFIFCVSDSTNRKRTFIQSKPYMHRGPPYSSIWKSKWMKSTTCPSRKYRFHAKTLLDKLSKNEWVSVLMWDGLLKSKEQNMWIAILKGSWKYAGISYYLFQKRSGKISKSKLC